MSTLIGLDCFVVFCGSFVRFCTVGASAFSQSARRMPSLRYVSTACGRIVSLVVSIGRPTAVFLGSQTIQFGRVTYSILVGYVQIFVLEMLLSCIVSTTCSAFGFGAYGTPLLELGLSVPESPTFRSRLHASPGVMPTQTTHTTELLRLFSR